MGYRGRVGGGDRRVCPAGLDDLLWRNEHDRRQIDEAMRRAHALNAWIEGPTMYALNSGPEPITDWHVATCSSWPCQHEPGSHAQQTLMSNRTRGTVAPGRTVETRLPARTKAAVGGNPETGLPPAIVGFVDWGGNYWMKDGPSIELVRLDEKLDRRRAAGG